MDSKYYSAAKYLLDKKFMDIIVVPQTAIFETVSA